jgi:hypothetical protein
MTTSTQPPSLASELVALVTRKDIATYKPKDKKLIYADASPPQYNRPTKMGP